MPHCEGSITHNQTHPKSKNKEIWQGIYHHDKGRFKLGVMGGSKTDKIGRSGEELMQAVVGDNMLKQEG